ncbi:MAG: hypothetical protein JJU29_06900 [Verrucomicrobia bacterium]|nr:hypothetical protein [Verrucomicrobiota bacterium]
MNPVRLFSIRFLIRTQILYFGVCLFLMTHAVNLRGELPPGLTAGLAFGDTPGRVTLDSSFSLAGRAFTVEAWIWLDAAGGDRPVLGQIGTENLLHLLIRNDRIYFGFWNDDLNGNTPVPTGEWVHVAYSFDADTRIQRIFLNGVQDGERVADGQFAENSLPLLLGGYSGAAVNPFHGRMLEVRIWDHVRDAVTISDQRFTTPASDAPGLDVLFTFEGIHGAGVPEATGTLETNALVGDVHAVSPVLAPSRIDKPSLPAAVAPGSLADRLSGYTLTPPPDMQYPDTGGDTLTDGLGPLLVWGAPWFSFTGVATESVLAWNDVEPELTFHFAERVRIDTITLHAADGDGISEVSPPTLIQVRTPGGFVADVSIPPVSTPGRTRALALNDMGMVTDEVTLTLSGDSPWMALAEVSFDGEPLAMSDPAPAHPVPKLARLFHGYDPALDNEDVFRFDLDRVGEEVRFGFRQSPDPLGVAATVEWSTDLDAWTTLPHESSPVEGKKLARHIPDPAENKVFFRLRFEMSAPLSAVHPPFDTEIEESEDLFHFPAGALLGSDFSLGGEDDLTLIAVNDHENLVGSLLSFAYGVTLRIEADGSGTVEAPKSMPGTAVLNEEITYTVINRLGESVRRTFAFTVIGENDPPTVEDFTGNHTVGTVDAGIAYRYFEGDYPTEESLLAAEPVATGRIPTFNLDPATAADGYGFEFTGELFVPAAGPYTFYTGNANGVVLDINGERVVDNTYEDPATGRSGTITLAAGTHTLRVRYFDAADPEPLTVDYSGPGLPREPIPASAFPRLSDLPIGTASDIDDGDVLHISHLNGIALADGAPAVLPSGAKLTLAADGQITYLPAPGRTLLHEATGTDNFTYTVTDSGGLSATGTAGIDLARLNTAPTAVESFHFATNHSLTGNFQIHDLIHDADGDSLRVTHVNGVPWLGGEAFQLPSKAILRLPTQFPGVIDYDGAWSFVNTLSQNQVIEQFSFTATDAAGATVTLTANGDWIKPKFHLIYLDRRLPGGEGLSDAEVVFTNLYRHDLEVILYGIHKETGTPTPFVTRTIPSGESLRQQLEPAEGIPLGEMSFLDAYEIHIDTVEGDPLFYYNELILRDLYSTHNKSFFEMSIASNPHWPVVANHKLYGDDGYSERHYQTGSYVIEVAYGSIVTLTQYSLVDADPIFSLMSTPANTSVVEPGFAANILIEAICRTNDLSRFTAQNLNEEDIVLTVGNEGKSLSVPAGQTVAFEVNYWPTIPVKLLDGDLGLHNSSATDCPRVIDFSFISFCADAFTTFTQVINNGNEAFTVRIQSVEFPTLISSPVTIAAGSDSTIQMDSQGRDIQGTEGRVVIMLESGMQDGPTFTFSDENCF